jgi:PAS domain S-box-containing protein
MLNQGPASSFIIAGGDMGKRMREFDWRNSPLGPADDWPQSIRTLTGVMLNALQPMYLAWGPQLTLLYNDAYSAVLAKKHPRALGRPFFETWPEVAEQRKPLIEQVFSGVPIHMEDNALLLHRNDAPELAHFNFSYTPVRNENGAIIGLFCACIETTRSIQAKEQADKERQRLAQLFEQGPSFMALLSGPEYRFELANAAYLRLTGNRELLGKTMAEALPDAVDQGYLQLLDEVFASGKAVRGLSARFDAKTAEGEHIHERYVDFIFQPIKDSQGRVIDIFVEGSDVTSRKQAEDALRSLNADLERQVAERVFDRGRVWKLSPDLMCVLGPGGMLESTNPAWGKLLGWSAQQLAGHTCFEFMHPDDRAGSESRYGEIVEGQPSIQYRNRYRCRNGSYRWISWLSIPEKGRVYCTGRDITEEKALADQLAEQMQERTLLWTNSRDLLLVFDRRGVIREVSPAATTLLGWALSEMEGHSIFEFIHPEDQPSSDEAVQATAKAPILAYVNRCRHKNGGCRWLSWAAVRQGELIYANGRDVTLEKEREAALARAEDTLRQSQKMEAVGQLTGGLAHDINNLLAGIGGSLELLELRLKQGKTDSINRYIDVAKGGIRRAAALTHRLLAFSRRQTLAPKSTDLNQLIRGVEELVRRTMGPAVEMEIVHADSLWATLVDPNQLENALLNLCINARDAMPEGGRIIIETANIWLDERSAFERDLPAGPYVKLCVSDTGTGMTPEVISRAFDPFFTTKPLGDGTGLGLSMVHGFVRQSGGQVRIHSELGRGTTLSIYLPQHDEAPVEVARPTREVSAALQFAGKVVLIVDDEPDIRMLLNEVLPEIGFATVEAADGVAGLKVLQSTARVDLMITDVGLPGGLNGRQVADAARMLRPDLKVLFITGYADQAALRNGHFESGMQIVTKPFSIDTLMRRIQELLA